MFEALDQGVTNLETPHMMINKMNLEKFGNEMKAYHEKKSNKDHVQKLERKKVMA